MWHRLLPHVAKRLPALDGARYDGYTVSSGEWFVPFGVRCLTYPLFWTIGRACLPPHTLSVLHARLHASRGRARAALWLLNASCWAYSLLRLQTGGTNFFTSATPNVWASRLPRSHELHYEGVEEVRAQGGGAGPLDEQQRPIREEHEEGDRRDERDQDHIYMFVIYISHVYIYVSGL